MRPIPFWMHKPLPHDVAYAFMFEQPGRPLFAQLTPMISMVAKAILESPRWSHL